MLEENPSIVYSSARTERSQDHQMYIMNHEVIKLIKHKTLPLNKERFHHLQKIANARKLHHHTSLPPKPLSTQHNIDEEISPKKIPLLKKCQTSRNCGKTPSMNTLINRLKNLKELRNNSQLMNRDVEAQNCWENLRRSILSSQTVASPRLLTEKEIQNYLDSYGQQQRAELKQVIDRAEKYLRIQKHSLRQRYCRMEEERERHNRVQRQTEIEQMLSKLVGRGEKNHSWYRFVTNEQLQRQLLVDIKQNFLEASFNRIKRDINHKKIVRMK